MFFNNIHKILYIHYIVLLVEKYYNILKILLDLIINILYLDTQAEQHEFCEIFYIPVPVGIIGNSVYIEIIFRIQDCCDAILKGKSAEWIDYTNSRETGDLTLTCLGIVQAYLKNIKQGVIPFSSFWRIGFFYSHLKDLIREIKSNNCFYRVCFYLTYKRLQIILFKRK